MCENCNCIFTFLISAASPSWPSKILSVLMQNTNTKRATPLVCLYHPTLRARTPSLTLTVAHFLAKRWPQGKYQSSENEKNTTLLSLFYSSNTLNILKKCNFQDKGTQESRGFINTWQGYLQTRRVRGLMLLLLLLLSHFSLVGLCVTP